MKHYVVILLSMVISTITGYFMNCTREYLKARNVLVHGTQQIETITFFS